MEIFILNFNRTSMICSPEDILASFAPLFHLPVPQHRLKWFIFMGIPITPHHWKNESIAQNVLPSMGISHLKIFLRETYVFCTSFVSEMSRLDVASYRWGRLMESLGSPLGRLVYFMSSEDLTSKSPLHFRMNEFGREI